jgi:hypothetical protein
MKRFLQCLTLLVAVCSGWKTVTAQRTEFISLLPKQIKVTSSNFSKVEVIDSRLDTSGIVGMIQRGAFNRKVTLRLEHPMQDEVGRAAATLIDSAGNKEDGALLINIRKFNISENTGALSESGSFRFRAVFYIKHDTMYKRMYGIDETVTIPGGLDVTKRLLENVPELLGSYIKAAVTYKQEQSATARQYSLYDILHIDELERKDIPVFQVDVPKKGLYATYNDFKNNRPSSEKVIVEHKKGFSRPLIYEMNENGKKGKEILRKDYYVVCDGEKFYISRPHNLYELTKANGNFYFTGVGKDGADAGATILAYAAFGLIGGFMAINHDTAIFEFELDHVSGKFVPIKKIRD